tara:strand:- start:1302 stop:1478 length:177 start_codon:yes stop_codon:yes gene_type:complete
MQCLCGERTMKETEYTMQEIDKLLDFGWRQVDERIEELRELQCLKEEMVNNNCKEKER